MAAFVVLSLTGIPPAHAAVNCTSGKPTEWEVITDASSGGDRGFICNYRVTKKLPDGTTTTSGTAITVEYFCYPDAGVEAFDGKTSPRDTETARDGFRVVIEEGPKAKNPDNPQREGVFSSFFPGETFDLFEKEWLLFANRQAVATIVVLTNKADGRHSVKDVEGPARQLAFVNAPESPDCKVPITEGGGVITPVATSGGKTGTVGTGGGVNPAVVATAAAAGGGAVVVVRRRRRRVKFKPPKPMGGGPNPWDPTEDEQRKKWERERKVWDPDNLTWRNPEDRDFEGDVPEDPTPVEKEIPVETVPTNCLDIYWRYSGEQAKARDVQRLITETNTKLSDSEERLRTNILRANAQLGFDIGGAIGGMTAATFEAARAALKPMTGRTRMSTMSEIGDEIRSKLRERTAALNAEVNEARGRLARSQLELELSNLDAARIRNAIDDAADDLVSLRRQLGELPPTVDELASKRQALMTEQKQLENKISALRNEQDVIDDYINFRYENSSVWERQPAYNSLKDKALGLDKEMEELLTKAGAAPGKPLPKLSAEASARFDELQRLKAQVGHDMEAAFDRFLHGEPGFDHNWPPGKSAFDRKRELVRETADVQKRLDEIPVDQERIKMAEKYDTPGDAADPQRVGLKQQIAEAEQRRATALADQQKRAEMESKIAGEQKEVAASEKKIGDVEKEASTIVNDMTKIANGHRAGMAPAVLLGAALAWLSPAAAVMAVVTIIAWAGADFAGIGPQSPEQIWTILTTNKLERDQLKETLTTSETTYDQLIEMLPKTMEKLKECMNPPASPAAMPAP